MKRFLLFGITLFLTAAYAITASGYKQMLSKGNINVMLSSPEQINKYKFGDYLIVTSKTTSVRKGAGADYGVVQTIKKNGLLKYLSSNGNWHKVIVVGTDRIGYVYHRNVK